MIRGMSYPKGIFYMDNDYIAHATLDKRGNVKAHLFPFDVHGLLFFMKSLITSFPFYFVLLFVGISYWVFKQPNTPFYLLLMALFGYHFFFPYPLKQFHGAEHKIFSHTGIKSLETLHEIGEASIVNRNCSTNSVVIFFLIFLLGFLPLGGNLAALVAVIGVFMIPRWIQPLDNLLFPVSAFIQERWTTIEPDHKHLLTGLISYLTLVRRELITKELLERELEEHILDEKRQKEEQEERLRLEELERIRKETEWTEI